MIRTISITKMLDAIRLNILSKERIPLKLVYTVNLAQVIYRIYPGKRRHLWLLTCFRKAGSKYQPLTFTMDYIQANWYQTRILSHLLPLWRFTRCGVEEQCKKLPLSLGSEVRHYILYIHSAHNYRSLGNCRCEKIVRLVIKLNARNIFDRAILHLCEKNWHEILTSELFFNANILKLWYI